MPEHPQSPLLSADQQALLALRRLRARVEQLESARHEPIAIVGIGCRFPGADGPDQFWRLLHDGVDAITEVPPDRWRVDDYYDPDPDAAGKTYARHGGFLNRVDVFDPQFFGISPREALNMDPQQRLMLEVAWEALEHAAIAPDRLIGTDTGVFAASSTHDYGFLHVREGDPAKFDAYFGTGNAPNAIGGRISYALGLQGPCVVVDTACSSSLVAVHLACQSLRNGECRLALAGGVNVILVPEITINFSRARMLARDGRCKTFDAAADGYVRGEGAAMVALKRVSDAVADNDRILAVIRGSAINQDGRSGGFTAPNELAQQAVIRRALASARLEPHDVTYVEAHGTGTSLGDPIEVQALAAVLGQQRASDNPLFLGSVKTNFGHLEAAAGVAGLVKVVLSLVHKQIPPHLHFKQPNPHAPLSSIPAVVPTALTEWQPRGVRRAGVSSFGFTGMNAHVIVEEAPAQGGEANAVERPRHVLTLSARTSAALEVLAKRWADRFGDPLDTHVTMADAAFSANVGRARLAHRACVIASDTKEAATLLESLSHGQPVPGVITGRVATDGAAPPVAFLFTGQGSQYSGMSRELYETQPVFRRAIDRCAEVLDPALPAPLTTLLFDSARGGDLNQTGVTQPALFAVEFALAELWQSWGVRPSAVIGHSVGECVAATVAGVFSVEDGLSLIARRASLMQALPAGGGMAAVFAAADVVSEAVAAAGRHVSIAADNGPENIVVAGEQQALDGVLAALAARGIKSTPLQVSHAFHSALMEPMLAEFEAAAAKVTYRKPSVPIVSNVTGRFATADELGNARYWRRHVRDCVRFADGIRTLVADGTRVFLEIGPTPTLSALGQRAAGETAAAWLPSLQRGRADWDVMLRAAGELYTRGVDLDWQSFDQPYGRRRVSLPTYPFERERHWVTLPKRRSSETATVPATAEGTVDASRWQYDLVWRTGGESGPITANDSSDWVIFTDGGTMFSDLADRLAAAGRRYVMVAAGEVYQRHDQNVRLRPSQAEDFERLWSDFELGSRDTTIVFGWAIADAFGGEVTAALGTGLAGLLHVSQQMLAQTGAGHPRLEIVTRGAHRVEDSDHVAAAQAAVWGFARSFALEAPLIQCRRIDLDSESSPGDASRLWTELQSAGEDQVAIRNGVRYVPRLVPVPARAEANGANALSAEATYLVTGGFGSLGLRAAAALVDSGAQHLVLCGRRGLTVDACERVAELQRRGAHVTAVQADVANAGDVARLLDTISATLPPLRGIVHAAGVLDDSLISEQRWDRAAGVLSPKVAGAWHLHQLIADTPLDFFVLFSSSAAVLGSPGQCIYAAANACLDALAHQRAARGQRAISVNWGPWADGGMAATRQAADQARWARQGWTLIPPATGGRLLIDLLQDSSPQRAVFPVDWSQALGSGEPPAFLSEIPFLPGATVAGFDLVRALRAEGEERQGLVEAYVSGQVRRVLSVTEVTADEPIARLGLDSLMALELRNVFERDTGVALKVVGLMDGASVRSLARQIGAQLPMSQRASDAILAKIDELSDHEVSALLASLDANQ
jgi:acyl transferase domain-containing protein